MEPRPVLRWPNPSAHRSAGHQRRLEAADLSWPAFLRATELLQRIRAVTPDLPFRVACNRALRQAHDEDQAAEINLPGQD